MPEGLKRSEMTRMVEVVADADELARSVAQLIVAHSKVAISRSGLFTIALSGGSTPKRLYELMADPNEVFRSQLNWSKTHFFWTDERQVPPDHAESNYHMAYEAMLAHVPVPASNLHRVLSEETDPLQAARDYESQLQTFFSLETGQLPRFDLVLLGLGTDGHTASLFPGSELLQEKQQLVGAAWIEKLKSYRFTLTLPVLNNASTIAFLVSGAEKANVLHQVLQQTSHALPAQLINPTSGSLVWFVDKAAAINPDVPQ